MPMPMRCCPQPPYLCHEGMHCCARALLRCLEKCGLLASLQGRAAPRGGAAADPRVQRCAGYQLHMTGKCPGTFPVVDYK